jgi:heterodisulfide reductase subunit A2
MKTVIKTGIFLCECGGRISNRIDLAQVSDLLQNEPQAHLRVYPYPCLAPGLEAIRREVQAKGLNRILLGACSSRIMKKRFTKALALLGLEPHQVEMINLKNHVAAVHEATPWELARQAAVLLAGGLASLRLLEPYEAIRLPFTGPALILGGGLSGFMAARELARQGMESVLWSREQTPERVLEDLHRTFPGCGIFCGELGELLREVFASPRVRVRPDQPLEYISGGVGGYRVGLRQPDGNVTEVAGVAIITALDREFGRGDLGFIGGGERVCDLLDLEEKLRLGDFRPGKVVFWVNSPQIGQAAQKLAALAAWRDSLLLAREHPLVTSTVLYPANITLPLTGSEWKQARAQDIGLVSYAPEVHPVIQSGFLSFVSPSDHLEHEEEWDLLVVPGAPGEPSAKARELIRCLPFYPESGGRLPKGQITSWPDRVPDASLFFTGSAGGFYDLDEVLQQGQRAARRVLLLREKARRGRLASPVVVQVDKELCEGCGLCIEICPCGGLEHVKPGSDPAPRGMDHHICGGGGTCAASCPHEAIKVVNSTTRQLEARIKAMLARMQENEILGFVCDWGGLAAADQAAVKGITYPNGMYLIPVTCLGSVDPTILSAAFLNGAKGIMLAGCTPNHSCHYRYGVDHCWTRVNAMKKLLSLGGLERRRITLGYVEVNEPGAFVRMVESQMEAMGKLDPLPRDAKTRDKLWAIHTTLHRPRVRWVLGTNLRRPCEKEFPSTQVNAVDVDETMLEVLREEFLTAKILKALSEQPLNLPGIAKAVEEQVEQVSSLLTDMAKEGHITLKGWEDRYPVYVLGKVPQWSGKRPQSAGH